MQLAPYAIQEGSSWGPRLVVLCQFCDSEPLMCVFLLLILEQRRAAHSFTAVLISVVLPHLAAVWPSLWKSSLFHFGPLRSVVLQTSKAIITGWPRLWDEFGCHGDLSTWIQSKLVKRKAYALKKVPNIGVESPSGRKRRQHIHTGRCTNKYPLLLIPICLEGWKINMIFFYKNGLIVLALSRDQEGLEV